MSLKKKYILMEIVRVKLNPEQAVLSCCESGGRGQIAVTPTNFQCSGGTCPAETTITSS